MRRCFLSALAVDMFLPAYLLMGMSGKPTQLSVLSCANEFPNPSLIMTIYSGVYSGSALIFSLFEVRSVTCMCLLAKLRTGRVVALRGVDYLGFRLFHERKI